MTPSRPRLHPEDRPGRPSQKRIAQDANAWAAKFRREKAEQEAKEKKQ